MRIQSRWGNCSAAISGSGQLRSKKKGDALASPFSRSAPLLIDGVAVPVHLPRQWSVEIQIVVLEEDALLGVDPAGVAVGLFGLHGGDAGIQECIEVRNFITSLRRRLGLLDRRLADPAEARAVVPGAVHDD